MSGCPNPRCTAPQLSSAGRCANCGVLFIGTLVRHRYEIEKMVGKGGFGITYLVSDTDCFNEHRILKELSPKNNNSDEEDISITAERLFKREAQVLLTLQHPGIPKLYAYFIDQDFSYLVQDFIPGQTLAEELEKQKRLFNEKEACGILLEIADILDYLHMRTPPIVHRDIKPQNIMRHANGLLQLIDFGAVCQAATGAMYTSQTLIGSPGYAPPEQIFGHPVPQSDLYAAGATILRLISGIHPSQLFNNRTQQLEWQSRVKVSADFGAILADLLVRDVSKRMATAAELKSRVAALVNKINTNESLEISAQNLPVVVNTEEELDSSAQYQVVVVPETNKNMASLFVEYLYDDQTGKPLSLPPDELGDLRVSPIVFLLSRFYKENLSGCLICSYGNIVKKIYVSKGQVTFASSSIEQERLGMILIEEGRLTDAEFEEALAMMKLRSLRFSSALLAMRKFSEEELQPFITKQILNIICTIFDWPKGNFELWQSTPPEEEIKVSLPLTEVIFQGLRRMENVDLLKVWLKDFTRKVKLTKNASLLYQSIKFDPKEAFIASRIYDEMSIEELLSLGGLLDAEVLRSVCGLLAVGILEWVAAPEPATPSARTATPPARTNTASYRAVTPPARTIAPPEAKSSPLTPTPSSNTNTSPSVAANTTSSSSNIGASANANANSANASANTSSGAGKFDIQSVAAFCYEVENTLTHFKDASYYAILDIDRNAAAEQITEAYGRLAQKFHPNQSAQISQHNISIHDKLENLSKHLLEAYQTLSNPVARAEYDKSLRKNMGVKAPTPTPPASSSMRPASNTSRMSAVTTPPSASGGSTRTSPPPVLPPGPSASVPKASYEVSETKMPNAMLPVPPMAEHNSRNTNSVAAARSWFQKGLEYYNTNQIGQACRAFQAAASADPRDAEYQIYLARSLALMKGLYTEAEQSFYRAIELSPKNADYYAELGLFYQKINMGRQAEEMFSKALELAPNHPIVKRIRESKKSR